MLEEFDKNDAAIEKEFRLERQRRQESSWMEKREHWKRVRWAKEWLEEVVDKAQEEVNKIVATRVTSLLDEILEGLENQSKYRRIQLAGGLEIACMKR